MINQSITLILALVIHLATVGEIARYLENSVSSAYRENCAMNATLIG